MELANALLPLMDGAGVMIARRSDGTMVNSGWRPPTVNSCTPGASPTSWHMTGQAVDLHDPQGALDRWCSGDGLPTLMSLGLWLEHPDSTPGWCHVQLRPPGSGNRVFKVR